MSVWELRWGGGQLCEDGGNVDTSGSQVLGDGQPRALPLKQTQMVPVPKAFSLLFILTSPARPGQKCPHLHRTSIPFEGHTIQPITNRMEKLEIDTWKDVCLLQICEFKRERKKNSKIQEKTCSVIPFLILKKKVYVSLYM